MEFIIYLFKKKQIIKEFLNQLMFIYFLFGILSSFSGFNFIQVCSF